MTERWLPVSGHEGEYEVSDHGRVRSVDRVISYNWQDYRSKKWRIVSQPRKGRLLNPLPQQSGHLGVNIGAKKRARVHVLVLEAFVSPRPNGKVSRHIDGDPTNNHATNLCWGTVAENVADTDRHGRLLRGSRCSYSKLTEAHAAEIRRQRGTMSQTALAAAYNVSKGAIQAVMDGRSWNHVGVSE